MVDRPASLVTFTPRPRPRWLVVLIACWSAFLGVLAIPEAANRVAIGSSVAIVMVMALISWVLTAAMYSRVQLSLSEHGFLEARFLFGRRKQLSLRGADTIQIRSERTTVYGGWMIWKTLITVEGPNATPETLEVPGYMPPELVRRFQTEAQRLIDQR